MSSLLKKPKPRKNYKKIAKNYFIFAFIVLVIAGVYGYFQAVKLLGAQDALSKEQDLLISMQKSNDELAKQYAEIKNKYNEDFKSIRLYINSVLPPYDNYTELTRQLDDVITKYDTNQKDIFMSNLQFGKPRVKADNDYATLPFSLTLKTTQENFKKFLLFVENSGSLDAGTRLLSINSIAMNFPKSENSDDKKEVINVNLSLNAYLQKSSLLKVKP